MDKIKYSRTPHLPWSNWLKEDKILLDLNQFNNPSIILEKVDGENTSMTRDYIWPRSLDSNNHESRSWVKELWGKMKYLIPDNMIICGENMYARHSIYYDDLESYFLVFNIWEGNTCLSWNDTKSICNIIGLTTVPELQKVNSVNALKLYHTNTWNNKYIQDSGYLNKKEGYVVRTENSFSRESFGKNVAKYVRPNHVQTDIHWTKDYIPNKLKSLT